MVQDFQVMLQIIKCKPRVGCIATVRGRLNSLADLGGPRCRKRGTLVAIEEAARFAEEELASTLERSSSPVCTFSERNKECRRHKCPFFANGEPLA